MVIRLTQLHSLLCAVGQIMRLRTRGGLWQEAVGSQSFLPFLVY